MFKSIKEFFVGKPKAVETTVELPVETPPKVETEVVVSESATVNTLPEAGGGQPTTIPETVTISVTDNVSINLEPDTITVIPPASDAWPFPKTQPAESAVKKKRTPATGKKPTPAIKATKPKPRKKK